MRAFGLSFSFVDAYSDYVCYNILILCTEMELIMEYVKILFSILVTMPILVLGGWLFLHYFETVFTKNNTRDTDKNRK